MRLGKMALFSLVLLNVCLSSVSINWTVGLEYPVSDYDYQWECIQSKDESISVGDRILLSYSTKQGTWEGKDAKIWSFSTWYFDSSLTWKNTLDEVEYMAYQQEENALHGVEAFYYGEIYFLPESVSLELVATTINNSDVSIYDDNFVNKSRNLLILQEKDEDAQIRLKFDDDNILINKNITIEGTNYVEWRLLGEDGEPVDSGTEDKAPEEIIEENLFWILLLPLISLLGVVVAVRHSKQRKTHEGKRDNKLTYHRKKPTVPDHLKKTSGIKTLTSEQKEKIRIDNHERTQITVRESHVLSEAEIPGSLRHYIFNQKKDSGKIYWDLLPKEFIKEGIFLCEFEFVERGLDYKLRLRCFKKV